MIDLLVKALRDVGYDIPPRWEKGALIVASTLGGAVRATRVGTQWHLETLDRGASLSSTNRDQIAHWAQQVRHGSQIALPSPDLQGVTAALTQRLKAYAAAGTTITTETQQRVGQNLFREALMQRYHRRCPFSGVSDSRLLRASHIYPWAKCNDEQRLDPDNGFLMNVMLDAMFDQDIISVDEQGNLFMINTVDPAAMQYVKSVSTLSISTGNTYFLSLRHEIHAKHKACGE